jgi:ketosteroid isomerase-like protein
MKNRFYTIFRLAAMSMLPLGLVSAQSDSKTILEEARKAIAASNEIYFQAFVKNDPALLINRYAEDPWIMLSNAPALCGPDAVSDFFKIGYNLGVRNGKLLSIDVYGISEDIVAEIGFWKLYDGANIEFDDGKFLVLWKKTPKGWKMWRLSSSSSRLKKQNDKQK